MAKKEEKKTSKVMEILKTEYPFEGMLLAFVGLLVLLLGVYIYEARVLEITRTDWAIFSTPLRIQLFSILIILVGAGAVLYALLPFMIPGFKEMNRVSWPTREKMLNHSGRVLGFILFLGLIFVIYDAIFNPIFSWLIGVNNG